MWDININEPLFWPTLWYILAFLFIVFLGFRRATSRGVSNNDVGLFFLLSCFFCFSVFDVVTGDFFNFKEVVQNYDFSVGAFNHGEPIYGYIIEWCNRNYILFRLLVFGLACLLSIGAFKRFGVNLYIAVFFLFATNIRLFGYSRAILASSVFFYGLSFWCKPISKKVVSYVIGVCLILLSYQFHHSTIIYIALSPFVVIRGDKRFSILIILLIPVFSFVLKEIYSDILQFGLLDEYDDLQSKLSIYSEGLSLSYSIWGLIRSGLGTLLLYYEFYLCMRSCLKSNSKVDPSIRMLFSFVLIAIVTAIASYLVDTSVIIYYLRITRFLMIPITIIIVYLRQNSFIVDKEFRFLLLLGIALQLWDLENTIKYLI